MQAAFRHRAFPARFRVLGDIAQDVFQVWANAHDIRVAPFGFNRPPFRRFSSLTPLLRHMPDYLCETHSPFFLSGETDTGERRHVLVEVKGFGKDQTLKLKHETVDVLQQWQQWSGCPVFFFVFDSFHRRVSTGLSLDVFLTAVRDRVPSDAFVEENGVHKPYYAVPAELLTWESYQPPYEEGAQRYQQVARLCRDVVALTERTQSPDDEHVAALSRALLYLVERKRAALAPLPDKTV